MHIPRDLRRLARHATEQGWSVTQTRGGHLRWRAPTGAIVFTASTPSDHCAIENARHQLRRAGLAL